MGGMETDYERLSMGVPTKDELVNAIRIPEVEKKLDNMGRPVEKKNYNYGRGSKIFYKNTSTAEVYRVRSALYKGE
jgi:hypothetical protein